MRNINSRKLHAGLVALAAFSSVLVTGCSSEGIVDAPEVEGNSFIEVNVAIGNRNQSRSETGDLLANAFKGGESIDILYTTSSSSSVNVGSYTIDTDGTSLQSPGLSIPVVSTSTTTYSFYSSFPSGVWTTDDEGKANLSGAASFTVQGNQSSDENYAKSDLMLAYVTATAANPSATLTFKHCLSRIVVKSLTYTLDGVAQDVSAAKIFLPQAYTGAVSTSSWSDLCKGGEDVVAFTADNTSNKGIILKDVDNTNTYVAAIIPPGNSNARIIQVILNDKVHMSALPFTNFEAGKEYLFNLKLEQNGVAVELVGVKSWESGNDEGEQETGTDVIFRN